MDFPNERWLLPQQPVLNPRPLVTFGGFDPATAARVLGQPGKVNAINVEAAPASRRTRSSPG
jgi:hypothetical protein